MKHLITIVGLTLSLGLGSLHAAEEASPKKEPSPAQKAQQEKMKACNREAKDKTLQGDERKTFMKTCLSAKPEVPADQKTKMTTCNQEAGTKGLKGDERKTFMSDCLKK